MTVFTKTAVDIFAAQDASGAARKVANHDVQVWGTEVERALAAFQAGGGVVFDSKTEADGSLDYNAYTMAWVFDVDPDKAGIYQKQGASGSGSWQRVGDLPYSFILATNTNSGNPNAIEATTPVAIPAADGGALIALPIVADNTGSPVTVSFNGGPALTVKTIAGNDVPIAALADGMIIWGFKSGDEFRLVTDLSSAGILSGAEAAAEAAENAASRAQSYSAMLSADKIKFATVADLLADETMSYTPGEGLIEVGPGDIIEAGGFRYEVAASGATDAHAENAGGVKLYEAGPQFSTRERFAAAISRGDSYRTGDVVFAGGAQFVKDGGGTLSDLPGWSLVGDLIANSYSLWIAPDQPKLRTDEDGDLLLNVFDTSYADVMALWEGLRSAAPGYITRTLLGTDESGTYDIYKYVFEPPQYDRTLILSSFTHGTEISAGAALFRVMWHIVHEWWKYPQLAFLRHRVRIVVMPTVNPYGIDAGTRQNSNGVDINRNFDYRWDEYPAGSPFDHDYKGTAAFSEAESQIVRDVLAEYPEALAYLDYHSFGSSGSLRAYPIYVTPEFADASDIVATVHNAMRSTETANQNYNIDVTYNPSGFNYAAAEHGMFGANPEWSDDLRGTSYNKSQFRRQVEFFGNLLIAYAFAGRSSSIAQQMGPRVWFAHWSSGTPITQTGTSQQEIEDFRFVIPITEKGYLKLSGAVVCSATEAATILASPRVFQFGYGRFGANDTLEWPTIQAKNTPFENFATVATSNDRVCIPINAVIPVTVTGQGVAEASIGLLMTITAGTLQIRRYRMMVEFVPSALGDNRVQILTSRDREGQGVGAMQIDYPKNG